MPFDVVFLSRFNAFCGVSTYTEQLAMALSNKSVDVGALSSESDVREEDSFVPCIVGWSEDGGLKEVLGKLVELEPKIVHIQHEHGIFQSTNALLKLCRQIRKETPASIVMTAHTVPKQVPNSDDNFIRLAREVDGLVVHSRSCFDVFSSYPKLDSSRVRIIPHGMLPPVARVPREVAAKEVGLSPSPRIFRMLSMGFISSVKRHMAMLQVAGAIISRDLVAPKKLELVVVGKPTHSSQNLVGMLRKAAVSMGIQENIHVVDEFIPFSRLPFYYGAADLGIHMVASAHHSSSGSIRTDLSHGLPVIATRSEITADLCKGVLLVGSTAEMMFRIQRLAKQQSILSNMRKQALDFSRRHSWNNIAMTHIRLYEELSGESLFDRRKGVRSALFHSSRWLLGGGS